MKLYLYAAIIALCLGFGTSAIAQEIQTTPPPITATAKPKADEGFYNVVTMPKETPKGVTPAKKWLNVGIIFPKPPNEKTAFEILYRESDKLKAKGLDFHIFVSVGDKRNQNTWKQMQDSKGAWIFADYNAEKKILARRGTSLPPR
jgi:hypothetical protein